MNLANLPYEVFTDFSNFWRKLVLIKWNLFHEAGCHRTWSIGSNGSYMLPENKNDLFFGSSSLTVSAPIQFPTRNGTIMDPTPGSDDRKEKNRASGSAMGSVNRLVQWSPRSGLPAECSISIRLTITNSSWTLVVKSCIL